ncbi:MAG TPA: hypothetical protein VHD32_01345 [Candidatus Didemnitutus sp.]|nr:hypothetical protein [Candidatus Didemnitutus sp.]
MDRVTRLGANDEQAFLEASGSVADLDARIRRGDFAFRVYLDDFRTRTAFFPGLSDRQGRKLMGNNGVGVEVIVFPEMFPTEVYGQSRLAIEETRYDAMARFNRALFRRLEQMGFPASPRKR